MRVNRNSNDSRFPLSWGPRLAELGLDIRDVNVGRYIQIDLSKPRPEPEEFAEFGEFDTFTVLNPYDVPKGVWLYLNNKRPESRLPLHYISRLETVADRFYLQHDQGWEGVTLHIILGGDLRALSVDPSSKGVVTIAGTIDVSDREGRKLGIVSVADGATETTLRQIRDDVGSLSTVDFARQATLESVRGLLETLTLTDFASQSTLENVRVLLETLTQKDFATQATLEAIYAEMQIQTGLLAELIELLESIRDNTDPANSGRGGVIINGGESDR